MTTTAIMRWVREQRPGHIIAKAVLFAIASHSDRHGVCDPAPSERLLAEETDASQASVNRYLKVLEQQGLVAVTRGAGRGKNRYRLLITDGPVVNHQENHNGAPVVNPYVNHNGGRSDSQKARSDSRGARSDSQQALDLHERDPEELQEELLEEAASPPTRAPARGHTRESARGGRRGEIVPAAELNATATAGPAYVLVSAWAAQNPGVTSGSRRRLNRAVDQLLRQGALPELIPAALDAAHGEQWRNPVAALPMAYDDVRRHTHPPARAAPAAGPANRNDQAIAAFLGQPQPLPPRAIGGP